VDEAQPLLSEVIADLRQEAKDTENN